MNDSVPGGVPHLFHLCSDRGWKQSSGFIEEIERRPGDNHEVWVCEDCGRIGIFVQRPNRLPLLRWFRSERSDDTLSFLTKGHTWT